MSAIGIYTRVSSQGDREEGRFHSHEEQAERAAALAVAKGFVPGPVFRDNNVSGALAPEQRPGMGALLEAIDRGELVGIAAYALDRLSREPSHGDALVRRVTAAGGVLLAPDIPEAIDSPTGEFTFAMLLGVAKLYRRTAGARFASAKERSIMAGIPVGRMNFGYRRREDRRIERNPETAPHVRELFERRAAGDGWTRLARLLEERTGRHWSEEGVAAITRNRLYATGRLTYGDIVSEWDAGTIVDEPLWHAAQRKGPSTRAPRPDAQVVWLLTGLLKCGSCGYNLSPGSTNSGRPDKPKRRYYRCVNRRCNHKARARAERLEDWVVLRSFAVGDEVLTRGQTPDLGALEEELSRTERLVEQVMAEGAAEELGELWAPEVGRRRRARDGAAAALGAARQDAGVSALEFPLRDVWNKLSPLDRRNALRLFWKSIRVGPRVEGQAGTPVTLVARGPHAEVELELPA